MGEVNKSPLWDDNNVKLQGMSDTTNIKLYSSLGHDRDRLIRLNPQNGRVIEAAVWIHLDDFLKEFEYLSVCRTDIKESTFLKGKFISAEKNETENQEAIVSKCFYTIDVKRNNTEIIMGIHQEDQDILGGYLRSNIDMGFAIIEEDDSYYWLYDYLEMRKERDIFFKASLNKGRYHIVPMTTGVFLRRPFHLDIQKVPVDPVHPYRYSELHPYLDSVLSDLFRKSDFRCNSLLEASELNGFGEIISNKYLSSITQSDFNKTNFDKASCTKKGLTEFGFKSVIMKEYHDREEKFAKVLKKLGYDIGMFSAKSRIFMMSFYSNRNLQIKREDCVNRYMNSWAWDLYMEERLYFDGEGPDPTEEEDCLCFSVKHPHINGISYGVSNTDSDCKKHISIDMNQTDDAYFSPAYGIKDHTVDPDCIEYLCSVAIDPEYSEDFMYSHFEYDADIVNGSEVGDDDMNESEESEQSERSDQSENSEDE